MTMMIRIRTSAPPLMYTLAA
ncbi:MAG: hypothetical protein QOE10_1073, partial [Gaiellales bacterium]|nr:hypothetical protein [Gaiellales bacterium]